jgi:SBP domain
VHVPDAAVMQLGSLRLVGQVSGGAGRLPQTAALLSPVLVSTEQVDGCKRHLSREKTYFRRYRCCMSHSKQPAVLVEGQVRRWCQQCCCFHELSAFDGEKR